MVNLQKLLTKVLSALSCDLLYDGTFTTGSVTLRKSIANYMQLVIVAQDNDGWTFTRYVVTGKGNSCYTYVADTRITTAWYIKGCMLAFSGSTMSCDYNKQAHAGGISAQSDFVRIKQVYGLKYIVGGGT